MNIDTYDLALRIATSVAENYILDDDSSADDYNVEILQLANDIDLILNQEVGKTLG